MYEALLFDLDGVLVDSERAAYDIWKAYLKKHESYALSERTYASIAGLPSASFRSLMETTLPGDMEALLSHWVKRMDVLAFSGRIEIKAGYGRLQAFLRDFEGKKAIVTSNGGRWLPAYLKKLQAREYFDAVIDGKMVERHKPAPDPYLMACEKLGVAPARCLAVEDSPSGIMAASIAGMAVIRMVDFEGFPPELEKLCKAQVYDLNGVVDFLLKSRDADL